MTAYFKLFRQFILRALARNPLRSGITILGISLGVAVMIAIRLANASSLDSFRAATEQIAGETALQITGTAGRFDELLLRDLGWLRQFGQASPVISGYAIVEEGQATGATAVATSDTASASVSRQPTEAQRASPTGFLQILGVDVLRDRDLRRYRLLDVGKREGEVSARQFLALLTRPDSIILTEKFARRRGLALGQQLPLIIGDTKRWFTVRGLLLDEGPARALDGRFALMDIAAAQVAFGRAGLLDRVDVKLKREIDPETAEAEIARRLPQGLTIKRPETTYGQVERMTAAFHFNLNALGSIALLVGLFMIYNTISISVITRRKEVGVLRAIGLGRRMALLLFLGEALLSALVGTVIGLILGRVLASAVVLATATTVETFYIATIAKESVGSYTLGGGEVLLAFAVALPLSLVAAARPALEAARTLPIEAMRGAERLANNLKPARKPIMIALMLFASGYLLSRLEAVNGLPVFGYAAALALMFGGASLAPNGLWLVCRLLDSVRGRIWQAERKMASANLRGAIGRISISVAALAVSLAMMVAVSILIGSFRETVTYWVDRTLVADIYAKAATRTNATSEGEIADAAIALIRAHPQVAAIDAFTAQPASYEGQFITLGAGDFAVLLEHGRLLFKTPSDARQALREAIGQDQVVVSESFALRFDKQPGDAITLATKISAQRFTVVAVYYDYSNNRGAVVMDKQTYARHYGLAQPSSLSIYLHEGADAEAVAEDLGRTTGNAHQLVLTTNSVVRDEVVRIFNSTFSITYALEAIAIIVAGLGVISTLITLILERRGEFAILGFLGATRGQVRRLIVFEALMIGSVSQLIGILIGALLSLVLIYVINVQSFGWTIQFHFPWLFVLQSTLLIVMVTGVAGLYPATRALRGDSMRFAREE